MAQVADKPDDNKTPAYEEVIDIDLELRKREEIINLALTPTDDTWTVYNTKDPNISVCYKQIGNSNLYTVVGSTTFDTEGNGNIDSYFIYQESGFNDIYIKGKKEDKNIIEAYVHKLIDDSHQIVYQATKSGFMLIGDRDLCYMRTRYRYDNYTFKNEKSGEEKKYIRVLGSLTYSLKDSHPFYIESDASGKYVRADMQRSGYVLSCDNEDNNLNKFRITYVLTLDPSGNIPGWVVNQFAPSKGMGVKKFAEAWPGMMETIANREKNGNKTDWPPLFDKTNEKLAYKPSNSDSNDSNEKGKESDEKQD